MVRQGSKGELGGLGIGKQIFAGPLEYEVMSRCSDITTPLFRFIDLRASTIS